MNTQSTYNPLFKLSVEEFVTLQRQLIKEELFALKSNHPLDEKEKAFYNFSEAAKYLGVSKPTFSKIRKLELFPTIKVSEGRILFAKKDLDNYLESKKKSQVK